MRVELSWTVSASGLRPTRCCVCRSAFERGVVEADLISDSDRLHLGEVCPAGLERGPRHIEQTMRRNLRFSYKMAEVQVRTEKRASEEGVEACPSFKEYEVLAAGVRDPRYSTEEEAQAAWERGEW